MRARFMRVPRATIDGRRKLRFLAILSGMARER
jgi:hypothetical protein